MNMKMIKHIITGISVASTVLCMSACAHEEAAALTGLSIEHETEFGGAYLHISIDDFLEKGYTFGDSVRVEFSNARFWRIFLFSMAITLPGANRC